MEIILLHDSFGVSVPRQGGRIGFNSHNESSIVVLHLLVSRIISLRSTDYSQLATCLSVLVKHGQTSASCLSLDSRYASYFVTADFNSLGHSVEPTPNRLLLPFFSVRAHCSWKYHSFLCYSRNYLWISTFLQTLSTFVLTSKIYTTNKIIIMTCQERNNVTFIFITFDNVVTKYAYFEDKFRKGLIVFSS